MNKIVYCFLAIISLFVVGACVNSRPALAGNHAGAHGRYSPFITHTPVSTDAFRMPIQSGSTSTYPPSPTPPYGQTYWYDVYDWQDFLYSNGFGGLLYPTYPNGTNAGSFEAHTVSATKAFQGSSLGGAPITQDGIVGPITFAKARAVVASPPYRPITAYPTPPW